MLVTQSDGMNKNLARAGCFSAWSHGFSNAFYRCTTLFNVTFITYLLCFSSSSFSQDVTLIQINTLYQSVLNDYVTVGSKNGLSANMVNYTAIKKDGRLLTLLDEIQHYPKERLDSTEKKIAFYLNAYNILAIAKVTKHWPIFKLRSLGNVVRPVWTHPVGQVCGEDMTLRKLEHEILRTLGEPRIHFALNCASMSCPDLRLEPYEASKLEIQLREQTEIFLSQPGKGMSIEDNKVTLSPIFKWFADDFESLGGVNEFIRPFLPSGNDEWDVVGYFNYDWSVNCHLSARERKKVKMY